MLKKKTQILAYFVCLIIILTSIFSGCGGKETTSGTVESPKQEQTQTTTSSQTQQSSNERKYHVHYEYTMLRPPFPISSSDEATKEDGAFYDERWKMVADKFNVSFKYISVEWANWAEKIRLNISAGTLDDITMSSNIGPREYLDYAKAGSIKLLPADLETKYPNLQNMVNKVSALDLFKYENRLYAIPRVRDPGGVIGDYENMLLIRKDMVKGAGFTFKDEYTIEELYEMGKAIKAKYPDVIPYASIWKNGIINFGPVQYVLNRGIAYDESKNKYVYGAADPKLIEGIKWAKKFYDEGLYDADFMTRADNLECRSLFSMGRIFANIDGANMKFLQVARNDFAKNNPNINPEEAVDVCFQLSSDGKYMVVDSGNWWSEIIINPNMPDDKLDRYLSLYDYLCSEEGLYLTLFGIEGVHYKKEGDKIVSLMEVDPATGTIKPFGKRLIDQYYLLQSVTTDGVTLGRYNPQYTDSVKERVYNLYSKRNNAANKLILNTVDKNLKLFSSPRFDKFTLNPDEEIMRLIVSVPADKIETEWNKWLKDNESIYGPVIDEINAEYAKK